MNHLVPITLWICLFGFSLNGMAQAVDVSDKEVVADQAPPTKDVGKDKAQQYFRARKNGGEEAKPARANQGENPPRYLALQVGTFFSDQGYQWGKGNQNDIGGLNAGVTYRVGEWVNSMDLNLRVEYSNYSLKEGAARKVSVGGIVTFPDANSRFPLYFGGGLGAGLFVKQLPNESAMAVDYQLIAGARFLNVVDTLGFIIETGIKNHFLLFSDGQYNGVFVTIGTVFNF